VVIQWKVRTPWKQRDAASQKLEALGLANDEAWDGIREDMKSVWEKMSQALSQAHGRFK
jgi:hypothetical protein